VATSPCRLWRRVSLAGLLHLPVPMKRVPPSVLTALAAAPPVARSMGASRRQVLTTLLLAIPANAPDLIGYYRRAIIEGRFSPDPALVFSLFRSLDRKGRIDLATSACGSALDTPSFTRLLSLVHRTCSPGGREKDRLAEAISRHASLHWNIGAPGFLRLVRRLLRSRRGAERAHGVLCLESLSILPLDLSTRLVQLVRDSRPFVRCNAWSGAHALAQRDRLPAPGHRALLRESLAALEDGDQGVRRNARLFRRSAMVAAKPRNPGRRR